MMLDKQVALLMPCSYDNAEIPWAVSYETFDTQGHTPKRYLRPLDLDGSPAGHSNM